MADDRRRRSGLAAQELKVKKVELQLGEVAAAIDGEVLGVENYSFPL